MLFNNINVLIEDKEVIVTSLEMANILRQNHKNILAKIRENMKTTSELTFQPAKCSYTDGQNKERLMYKMSSDYAIYLSTLFTNDIAKQVRIELIKALREAQNFINESGYSEEFKYYRETGKIARKDLTDTIKEKLQPSNQFVYGNYTELGYLKVFGKKTKELKQERNLKPKDNLRNHFTPEELKEVLKVEEEIKSLIIAFNLMNIDKKEVYKKIKEIILKNQ